jgi:hypothetical protein
VTTATARTQPLLGAERPVDANGWPDIEHPYCPTYVELPGGQVVTKTPISSTTTAVYSAWEPTSLSPDPPSPIPHSMLTWIAGRWYGQIGCRTDLSPALKALPLGTIERMEAVGRWYQEQYDEACRLIRQAFPGRKFRSTLMGELEAVI